MNKQEAKKKVFEILDMNYGYSIKYVAEFVGKSVSTIYRYLSERYLENRFPILKKEIKRILFEGNFNDYINNLSYRDICLIRKEFSLYGYDKESKIKSILKYFKDFSILGLYPENLTKEVIKKAFYKKSKQVHPDMNKNVDKYGKEFQEVYQSYTTLLEVY